MPSIDEGKIVPLSFKKAIKRDREGKRYSLWRIYGCKGFATSTPANPGFHILRRMTIGIQIALGATFHAPVGGGCQVLMAVGTLP